MRIDGQPFHTIWLEQPGVVRVIDQRLLPHQLQFEDLRSSDDAVVAIRDMAVRGAPLIGVTAAFGLYLAARESASKKNAGTHLVQKARALKAARPTAVNLAWAVDRGMALLNNTPAETWEQKALDFAEATKKEDIALCEAMGQHGLELIREIAQSKPDQPVQVLTHCNAGWLATIDWGTATAPIYRAHREGIPVHVWVDETRPRNQGASLTAYELGQEGVPHTVIADNTGGHLMQHGKVDLVITGTDRTTSQGDVANKIGTYLKALAAKDNNIPFYVAAPSPSIDFSLKDGVKEIPIEERSADEVRSIRGWDGKKMTEVRLVPENSPALNYGFDVTPARLVTGLITERGVCPASEAGLKSLFPEKYPTDG